MFFKKKPAPVAAAAPVVAQAEPPKSFLSATTDANRWFYGTIPGDRRQLNVRFQKFATPEGVKEKWVSYVGSKCVGGFESKEDAEAKAVKWAKENPSD
jgi:hypothetical protein